MGDYYCAGSLDTHVVFGIFVASLRAVGCATTLASAGLWLARQGVMTPALSKGLSQLSVKLAIPCLLFSSVVPGVSSHVLSYAWPLLLLPAVHLLLGVLLGCLTALIVKPPGVRRPTSNPRHPQTARSAAHQAVSPACPRRALPAGHRRGVRVRQHDGHPYRAALGDAPSPNLTLILTLTSPRAARSGCPSCCRTHTRRRCPAGSALRGQAGLEAW